MSFYLKYELSRLLHANGAKTFQAVEKATRRDVLLHLVDKSASPELVDKVKLLRTDGDHDLVEVGEFAGSYYVVTSPVPDFDGLGAWLDRRASGLNAAPAFENAPTVVKRRDELVQPGPAVDEPGEFTAMFGMAEAKTEPPTPTPTPSTAPDLAAKPKTAPTIVDLSGEAPPRTPPPAAPSSGEAGEFTQLFGASNKPKPREPEPAEPPPAPEQARAEPASAPVSAPASEPGEFTKMFSPAAAMKQSPPAASPLSGTPVTSSSGEFTQLFGNPSSAGDAPARHEAKEPATDGGVGEGSGEFTRLFGNPGAKGSAAPRLQPKGSSKGADIQKSSGEFTQLFGPSGKGAQKPPKQAEAPSPSPLATPRHGFERTLGAPEGGAPGEFTQMFGGRPSHSSTDYGEKAPLAPRAPASSFSDGLVGEISGDEALDPGKGPRVSKQSKPFQAAGEFTRMFGPSDPSQPPPQEFIPAAQRSGGEGYASGLFRNPHAEQGSVRKAAPGRAAGEPTPGPGDYTLQFEGGAKPAAAPAAQAAAPAEAAAPAPAAKTSKGMLIALIAAVLIAVLALGAAAYLFFSGSDDEPEADPPAVEQTAEPGAAGKD